MKTKSVPFEFKSLDDAGTFEAVVAVFGNVDKGGDRIMPGAFKKTLTDWESSGDPIPVIFNHDWGSPHAHIGVVEEAKETNQGLLVKGRLDVADNDVAKQVHRLMQRRSLKEFSFGYSVPKGGERRGKDGANELLEVDLAEVGPTLKGMNPATELYAVKSALGGKRLVSDTRDQLDAAGTDRFGGQGVWVYVDDFDPDLNWVVYHVTSDQSDDRRFVRVLYTTADDGSISLAQSEEEVTRETTYRLVGDKSAEELRRQAESTAREVERNALPDGVPAAAPNERDDSPHVKELQEVKDQLTQMRELVDDLKKKAEEADKGTRSRSVDPLRQQAEAEAFEFATGGGQFKPPPKPAPKREPEMSLKELRQRTRDEMLGVLSGGTIE